MKAGSNIYLLKGKRLLPTSKSPSTSVEAFALDGKGSLRDQAFCGDPCTLAWKSWHTPGAASSSSSSLGLCLQLFPRGRQAALDESATSLTADFTALLPARVHLLSSGGGELREHWG